jgi:DNA-binding transcriptional LysR family regulator
MLDVRRLRVLRAVSQHGSFSAAAEALSYTQSAVSQQIAALEREAGTLLVQRNARGVRLTDAGAALVRHTEVILSRLADAESELEAIAGLRSGRLRLAAFASAGATIMPRAIGRFREAHPGIDLTLIPAEPDEVPALLKAGDVDIALTIDAPPVTSEPEGIDLFHLLDDPMYVCLPKSHERASQGRVNLEDLASESWILGSTQRCPDSLVFLRACQTAGFDCSIAFHSDDYLAIQGFVAAGVGLALIPDLGLVTVRDDVVIRSLTGNPPFRRISAAMLADGYRSPAASAMLDILAEVGSEFEAGRRSLALVS